MINNLDEKQIDDLLKKEVIGRIGCHAEGVTYVVPISYVYEDNCIYSHTYEGMKLDIMRKNSAVCFEVDDTRDNANWLSVIAWGNFEEITQQNQRETALQLLLNRRLPINSSATTHLGAFWPFSSTDAADIKGVVFKIKLIKKTGRFEKTPQSLSNNF